MREIDTHIQDRGHVKEHHLRRLLEQDHYPDRQSLKEELNNLVCNNYLYYNPTRSEYKLQGRSMEIGLARYVRDVGER